MSRSPWRAEIHLHTTASDGSMTPEEAVRHAKSLGLKALAVTDHDTFQGSLAAMRASRILGGPVVVYAAEVRSDHGDILVYCRDPHVDAPKILAELRDWANENNCLLLAAHPFHPWRSSIGFKLWEAGRLLDGVEAWNNRGPPFMNLPAMLYASRHRVPATSGSDAHVPQELGGAPVILPDEPRGPSDVLEWIREGLVEPTYGFIPMGALPHILAWSVTRRISDVK